MTDTAPTCDSCGTTRHPSEQDYSPIQVVTGQDLGWYSGDDGEICGSCMTQVIRGGRP